MPDKTTFEKVQEICVEILGVYGTEVKPELTFDDLGADSLDRVELTLAAEEEFDISISDDEAEGCKTVQQACDLIDRLVAEKGGK